MALDNNDLTPEQRAIEEAEAAKKKAEDEAEALRLKNVANDPDIAKLIQMQVDEKLKDIKGKLDTVYTERDEAKRKLDETNEALKQANLKRLEEEGKHKEALELRLADERAQNAALKKHNVELTRDNAVRNELSALDFRNQVAYDMALNTILGKLALDQTTGQWTASGVSIKDTVKALAADTEQQFLFKPKANSGGGQGNVDSSPAKSSSSKSLFSMSQAEVIALAAAGKL